MKNLPTYEQFTNENYLPYFGVKQALDDSKNPEEGDKVKLSDFHRIYAMSTTWWNAWKDEKGEKYDITQDAFTKTYDVKDKETGDLVFVYDYGRFKIFTNEKPVLFLLKQDVSPEDLEKAQDKDPDATKPEGEEPAKKAAKKEGDEKAEDEAEGENEDEFEL